MRNKKIVKIIIALTISIPILYLGVFLIQSHTLKNSFAKEQIAKFDEDTKWIRCDSRILEPEFAFAFGTGNGGRIGFYRSENLFYQTEKEWENNEIGGTTVINTTFPELVKMVKKDCYQFQEDYDNPLVDKGGIDWGYREVEPPKTEEELKMEKKQKYYDTIKGMKYQFDNFTDLQKTKFTEFYGDINSMNSDKIYSVVEQLRGNGNMVDESIKKYFFDEDDNPIFKKPE